MAQLEMGAPFFAGSDVLSAMDCERLVQELRPIDIEEVGTAQWKAQREVLEKMNIQAHHNLNSKKDEFVYEALLSFEKLPVVVHELLVIEVWKERVYPARLAEFRALPTIGYMYLHYEAVLVNLLEGVMFNEDALEALGDTALELCDYCYRRVLYLNAIPDEERRIEVIDKDTWIKMSPEEYANRSDKDMAFRIAMGSLAVLWAIVDKVPRSHMSIANNLLLKNDMPLQLIALVSGAPWLRRGKGVFQKYKKDEWVETPPHELLLLTPAEAHVWLCLHVLLCDPACRPKYRYDEYRKSEVLKLRRYVTERLVDQIPTLVDLQRTLDHLQIMEPPASHEEAFRATLVVECLPEMYARVVKGRNWAQIAARQVEALSDPGQLDTDVQKMSQLIDSLGDWEGPAKAEATPTAEVEEILRKAKAGP